MNEQIYEAEVCLPCNINNVTIDGSVEYIKLIDGSIIDRFILTLIGDTIIVKDCSEDMRPLYQFETVLSTTSGEKAYFKKSWLMNIRPIIQKRWRAGFDKPYYYRTAGGEIFCTNEFSLIQDDCRYASHNYYQTREEAQKAKDLQTIENELVALIEELNAGRKIDWADNCQNKYSLNTDNWNDIITVTRKTTTKVIHTKFCCIDENLEDKAIQRISKDRLAMYLRER